jgi:hypothetical protein
MKWLCDLRSHFFACRPLLFRRAPVLVIVTKFVSHSIENTILLLAFLSPPFLCVLVWRNFIGTQRSADQPGWKVVLDWLAIVCTTIFFLTCLIAAMVIPQDVMKDNWASVAKWRDFTKSVVRIAPAFLILALCGRKRTRLCSFLWIVAVVIDCLAVDMMA